MSYQHIRTKSLCSTIVNCVLSGDRHKNAAAYWLQELEDGQDELTSMIHQLVAGPDEETISRALDLVSRIHKSRNAPPVPPQELTGATFTTEEKRAV